MRAKSVDEYFALYIGEVDISILLVGYLFAVYSLLHTLASFIAHKFESRHLLLPILVIFSLIIFSIGFAGSYHGVTLFMLLAFISSIGQVLSNTAIQNNTHVRFLATVSSVSVFLSEILTFSLYLVFLFLPSSEVKQGLKILVELLLH